MNTPTIQDVNDLDCCCPLPECPGNRWEHQDRDYQLEPSAYSPWRRPDGLDDADDLPFVWLGIDYEGAAYPGGYRETGSGSLYQGWTENPSAAGEYAESLQAWTIAPDANNDGVWTYALTGNTSTDPGYASPTPFSDSDSGAGYGEPQLFIAFSVSLIDPWAIADADSADVLEAGGYVVTDSIWREDEDTIQYSTTAASQPLQGAGGSDDLFVYHFDVAVETWFQATLTGETDKGDLIAAANTALLLETFGSTETDDPVASCDVVWPTVGDLNPWPAGPDYTPTNSNPSFSPDEVYPEADVIGTQYKVGIPSDWHTMNEAYVAGVAAHAAWVSGGSVGPEPEVPTAKRSVFECQWIEVLIPKPWQDWRDAQAAWVSGGSVGTAPTKPTDPAEMPSLAAERDWTYGGPGTAAFSSNFQMTQPTVEGYVTPYNMLIVCYHSTETGVKPTAHGQQIDLEDPT